MKKKNCMFVCAIMVISLSIVSCTDQMETDECTFYTPEEKASIEKLAKEYGLDYELYEEVACTKTRTDFEKEFEIMSRIIGEYELYSEQLDNKILIYPNNKKSYSAPLRNDNDSEYGHYNDEKTFGDFRFIVEVTWPKYSEENPSLNVEVESTLFYNGVAIIIDPYCLDIGEEISFGCDISYKLDTNGRFNFVLDGNYNKKNHSGYINVGQTQEHYL